MAPRANSRQTTRQLSTYVLLLNLSEMAVHCELKKNWATFIFTVTLANVDRYQ